VRFECVNLDGIRITRFSGTLGKIDLSASAVARCPDDDFCLAFNRGGSRIRFSQHGNEALIGPGDAVLTTNGEPGLAEMEAENEWVGVALSRNRLRSTVAGAEDMLALTLDGRQPAARVLHRYLDSVLDLTEHEVNQTLEDHIGTAVADLVGLTLAAGRDAAEVGRARGLRAARMQEIFAAIKSQFADPALSSEKLGNSLGLSRRYVNDLLFETGATFVERVLELRLQKARAMLADNRNDRLKVSEIAYACGFNEVSYFNRCFRRRFGASPTTYRGSDSNRD
jgi:AraC-like DNA-binding protein